MPRSGTKIRPARSYGAGFRFIGVPLSVTLTDCASARDPAPMVIAAAPMTGSMRRMKRDNSNGMLLCYPIAERLTRASPGQKRVPGALVRQRMGGFGQTAHARLGQERIG